MLKNYLSQQDCLGVIRLADGTIRTFHRHGVVDLLELCEHEIDLMHGADVADRVIGRGAALLLVKGGVANVYAKIISNSALEVLNRAGISVSFDTKTPFIMNRKGNGLCPVEQLTKTIDDPDRAMILIKQFVESNKQNK